MMYISPLSSEKESVIPSQLISSLRTGNVLAWVGAGLSIGAGYPSWKDLIISISNKIMCAEWSDKSLIDWIVNNSKYNPEWAAEVLFNTSKHDYYESLRNIFDNNKNVNSLTHSLLAILPFKGYVTTNYDCLIEKHIEKFSNYEPKTYDYTTALNLLTDNSYDKFVLKIHGDIKNGIDKLIMTESEYYKLEKNDAYYKVLSWVFSKHTIICLGYSLKDKDFRSFINERFSVFKSDCPPIYAFIAKTDTCKEEINCYKSKYNVNLIPISSEYNFKEIQSTLLSLYCLYHRIDSKHYGDSIYQLINKRINKSFELKFEKNFDNTLKQAKELLCVFKDEMDIRELNSICLENNLFLSTAHIELIGKKADANKVVIEEEIDMGSSRDIIAKWISDNIATIPADDENPRFLSVYYKNIFFKYHKTLSYLLKHETSWNVLIDSNVKLKRIVEFYKQQGLWREWLEIASSSLKYAKSDIKIELVRSMLWIYFWTRDYNKLESLINEFPESDSDTGVNTYRQKLTYINKEYLPQLIKKLKKKTVKDDYFKISLLGRTYARLSKVSCYASDSKNYLEKAEQCLIKALEFASKSKDFIEMSVQYWYLALVQIDLNKIGDARKNLAEAKRLDENIMERVPGIAWLRMAEYRFAKKEESLDSNYLRTLAIDAMTNLGMHNIEKYIDEDYYY